MACDVVQSPENMSVRQLVAWLHFQGLDTECVLGSAPVMHFFFPKTTSSKSKEEPPSESTLMVAISRTALQMIMGYKVCFDREYCCSYLVGFLQFGLRIPLFIPCWLFVCAGLVRPFDRHRLPRVA